MDIESFWIAKSFHADYQLINGQLSDEHDIKTAVIISLFTDRRAENDDTLPTADGSKRGWWADAYNTRRIGSRLWLLEREKETPDVVNRAREYAEEALTWLIDIGVAKTVKVKAAMLKNHTLGLQIVISRNTEAPARYRFEFAWNGINQIRN